MNIFHLDEDPETCAVYHCDKHVVKMILETAQMLSTAWRQSDNPPVSVYKEAYLNHPMTKWVRETQFNYMWTYELFRELQSEYTYRYNKIHKSSALNNALYAVPDYLVVSLGDQEGKFTKPPLCMPEHYKEDDDYIQSYRNYYIHERVDLAMWTERSIPGWITMH